jgi:hypothetical protein
MGCYRGLRQHVKLNRLLQGIKGSLVPFEAKLLLLESRHQCRPDPELSDPRQLNTQSMMSGAHLMAPLQTNLGPHLDFKGCPQVERSAVAFCEAPDDLCRNPDLSANGVPVITRETQGPLSGRFVVVQQR